MPISWPYSSSTAKNAKPPRSSAASVEPRGAQRRGAAHLLVRRLEDVHQLVVGLLLGVDPVRGQRRVGVAFDDADLGVERAGAAHGGVRDRLGRGIRDRNGVLVLVEAEQPREQRDAGDHHERYDRRRDERLLAQALGDLAPGDEGDGCAAAHAATAVRNSSARLGRS
jgi:hypothetical protein